MSTAISSETEMALEGTEQQLLALLATSENQIGGIAEEFKRLAHQTEAMLSLAEVVVHCIEDESVTSILGKVQMLGAAAQQFIRGRIAATAGIQESVEVEGKMLEQLAQLARSQRDMARETQMLSVMTSIEVAHLGQVGAGFQYLARELDEFSRSVTQNTKELVEQIASRAMEINETKKGLATDIPRMTKEMERMESDLGGALALVDASLKGLGRAPAQFRICVQEIAAQITGMVAAMQGQDITRQQIEHVQEALALMETTMRGVREGDLQAGHELPILVAGLTIQEFQLRNIRETVNDWLSRLRACMETILRISSSEVLGIGPMVLEQEQGLARQLAQIAALESACQTDNGKIQKTLAGLLSLTQLVGDHLDQSIRVRDRLQLLTFNSIVEANRLGSKADAILAISQSIKRISTAWSEITDRSSEARERILELMDQLREKARAFSDDSNGALQTAQAETSAGLQNLRATAAFVAQKAGEIESSSENLKRMTAGLGASGDRLEASFAVIDSAASQVEIVKQQWQIEWPEAGLRFDPKEVERLYAARYTTEIERAVLRAALGGGPMPVVEHSLEGNSVELF